MTKPNIRHELAHTLLGKTPWDPEARTLADHLGELIAQSAIAAPSDAREATAIAETSDRPAVEPHRQDNATSAGPSRCLAARDRLLGVITEILARYAAPEFTLQESAP